MRFYSMRRSVLIFAVAVLTAALWADSGSKWDYVKRTSDLIEQKKFDAALKNAQEANRKFPNDSDVQQSLAFANIKRGEVEARAERYDAALPYYKNAYDLKPGTDWILFNYAIALSNVRKYEDAIAVYEKGVAEHPEHQSMRNNYVWALFYRAQEVRYDDAQRHAELAARAYGADPDHRGALQIYGESLLDKGDEASLRKAVEVLGSGNHKFPDSRAFCWPLSLAYRDLVERLHARGDAAGARKAAGGIANEIRGEPRCDHGLMIALGKTYAMIGAFEDIIPELERLAAKYPQHSIYAEEAGSHIHRYAVRLRTTGQPERAKEMRDRANLWLRRAMDVYERNHADRPVLKAPVRFPLDDPTMVIASFDTGGTHSGYGKYCYDFITVDERGSQIRPGTDGKQNAHYYGFGAAVHAVRDGIVDVADDGDPDPAPGSVQYETDGNYVRVKHGDGSFGWYVHLKNGSVKVKEGQRVKAGDKLGEMGNSGMSVSTHLHFCLITDDYVSLRFTFGELGVQKDIGAGWETSSEPPVQGWIVKRR